MNTANLTCKLALHDGKYIGTITSTAFGLPSPFRNFSMPHYEAMTAEIAGDPGTTTTYFLYTDDPGYEGGARPMVATKQSVDLYQAAGRLYVGSLIVTFPALSGNDLAEAA